MHVPDRETVEVVAPVVSPILQTAIEYRMTSKQVKRQAQMEKEIAETRAEVHSRSMQGIPTQQPVSGEAGEEAESGDSGHAVMDLMEEEDCNLCKSLLRKIDDLSGTRREKALAEYGRLKEKMETAGKGELKEFVDSTEVLDDVFEEVM